MHKLDRVALRPVPGHQAQNYPALSSASVYDNITPRRLRSRTGFRHQHRSRRILRKELEIVPEGSSRSAADIVKLLTETLKDVQCQESHMAKLRELALSGPVLQDEITKVGGLECVFGSMKHHFSSESLQVLGVDVLGHIVVGNVKSTFMFVAAGGVDALVRLMHECPSVVLREACCSLLRHVALCNAECRENVAASGVVESVLRAMTEHVHVDTMQEQGCRILKDLSAHHSVTQELIFRAGGASVVLRAMTNHLANSCVQEVACGVLRNMTASNIQHQDDIVARGGVSLALDAMAKHDASVSVQWACCWLLFCLAVRNAESKSVLTAHSAVQSVLGAMNTHRKEARVQEAGLWFLKEMAGAMARAQDSNLVTAAIQSILKAMERHTSDKKVRVAASGALQRFSAHDFGGLVRTISLGRCGRMGRNSTRHVLSVIEE